MSSHILNDSQGDIFLTNGATDKRSKFVEMAERRVTNTIKDIQLVGNLANGRMYEYERTDVNKIFKKLQSELDRAKLRFEQNFDKPETNFKLD